jgi:hypothetical protein
MRTSASTSTFSRRKKIMDGALFMLAFGVAMALIVFAGSRRK